MSFTICSKNIMNVAFLSNKIYIYIYIYSDPKNEDIMKKLWYFVIFLDFFFNIIKLNEPKFTILHTKSILIFSLLEAARAANASTIKSNEIYYKKSVGIYMNGKRTETCGINFPTETHWAHKLRNSQQFGSLIQ